MNEKKKDRIESRCHVAMSFRHFRPEDTSFLSVNGITTGYTLSIAFLLP